MGCVTSVTYRILLNGSSNTEITPSKGLRQWDPISPYLFLFSMQSLSNGLGKLEELNKIEGIKIRRTSPTITHLLFVDDCYIFSTIDSKKIQNIKEFLEQFSKESGQTINYEKSKVIFSKNTPRQVKTSISNQSNIQQNQSPGKYLGLPTSIGRNKTSLFTYIEEKITNKIQGWKENLLNQAEKKDIKNSHYNNTLLHNVLSSTKENMWAYK